MGDEGGHGVIAASPTILNCRRSPEAAVVIMAGWGGVGGTIRAPMRMRSVFSDTPSPVKPHLYPCPQNTPRVIVV